jgi:hypothetical protein
MGFPNTPVVKVTLALAWLSSKHTSEPTKQLIPAQMGFVSAPLKAELNLIFHQF